MTPQEAHDQWIAQYRYQLPVLDPEELGILGAGLSVLALFMRSSNMDFIYQRAMNTVSLLHKPAYKALITKMQLLIEKGAEDSLANFKRCEEAQGGP